MLKNMLNVKKIGLSGNEISYLIIGCELKEESILEKLVKSKNKEECEKLALEYNVCNKLKNILLGNENEKQIKLKFSLEECEFLIDSLNLQMEEIRSKFKGTKDDSFDELCVSFAKVKDLETKIQVYIKIITDGIDPKNIIKGDAIID